MEPPPPEEAKPKEDFVTIYKTERDSSFSIPSREKRINDSDNLSVSNVSAIGSKVKSEYPKEQIDALKSKIEPSLSKWVRYKKYHRQYLTYKMLADETNLKEKDLIIYFKVVEPIGFHAWIDRLRIEEAQSDMSFYTDEYFTYISPRLGFSYPGEFKNAFVRFVGESPDLWRITKAKKIQSGDDPLFPKFNKSLSKVSTAFSQWVETKNYLKPIPPHHILAKELGVTRTELYLYCAWVIKDTILNKIIDLRIEEAKQIILDTPALEIIDIANKVGYSSAKAFSNQFKKRTGETPGAWRKIMVPDFYRVVSHSKPSRYVSCAFDDEDVKKWISKKGYCKSNLSLKSVASECGFADFRFTQYLKQVENTTFNEWIAKLRLEEAKRILINNASLSTEQVGSRVGFSGKAGFWSWFKQQTGYTPEEWRSNVLSRKLSKAEADVHTTVSVPSHVRKTIEEWVEGKGYCRRRLSLKVMAADLGLSEDQISAYCYNEGYFQFPVWISNLRIKEAQRLLITYPSIQVIDVAYKVGMTDVKVFRGIFKRIVGALPTEWRERNCKSSVAEVMASIDRKPSTPFSLDVEKLRNIESTTSQAQGILSDIFVDEESEEHKVINQKAEDAITALIPLVLEKEVWSRADFDNLCTVHSIMPGFALERINDITFEKIGDVLIDDAEDVLYVNIDYKESLL